MVIRKLAAPTVGILISLAVASPAFTQAGPPCGPNLPIKCNSGQDAAILAGAAGVAVAALYALHRLNGGSRKETSIAGCTVQDNGTMTLRDDTTKTTYSLTSLGKKVKAGERVVLRGKKSQDTTGKDYFQVKKLVKDEGPCGGANPSAGHESGP